MRGQGDKVEPIKESWNEAASGRRHIGYAVFWNPRGESDLRKRESMVMPQVAENHGR